MVLQLIVFVKNTCRCQVGVKVGVDTSNPSPCAFPCPQRIVRAAAVVPFLTLMMIFPIGVLTGALSNLNTAVCGGTPGVRVEAPVRQGYAHAQLHA